MKRPAISLRPAGENDHDFLFALHRASMRDYVEAVWGWDDDLQSAFFREHFEPARLRIIEVDGEAVGVIGFADDGERFDIGPFEIDPDIQGRGIGSAVLGEMFAMADAAGIPATLQVLKVNTRALRLYERVGFEIVGETATHLLMCRPVNGSAARGDRGLARQSGSRHNRTTFHSFQSVVDLISDEQAQRPLEPLHRLFPTQDLALNEPEPTEIPPVAKISNERLATKVDWKGGVVDAITYGIRSNQIADPEMAELWAKAEKAHAALAPVVRGIESRLRAANRQ